MMKNNITLEEGFSLLQQITDKLQNGELSIEDSIKLYEEGTMLVKHCQEKLDKASLKITELSSKGKESEV